MRVISKKSYELNNEIILSYYSDNSKDTKVTNMNVNNLYIVNNDYICNLVNYETVICEYYKKEDIFLMSLKKYSNSTGKIQSKLKSFLSDANTIYCYDINKAIEINLDNYSYDIKQLFKKLNKARVINSKQFYFNEIVFYLDNYKKYLDFISINKDYNYIKNNRDNLSKLILELKSYYDINDIVFPNCKQKYTLLLRGI